jgi:lipoprotein-releasing system permease protein
MTRAGPLRSWLFTFDVARRFLVGARSRLLAGTARAALLSITLGVAAMLIAMALMSGYTQDLERKLVGSAQVLAYPILGESLLERTEDRSTDIQAIEGVRKVNRVIYGQGALSSATHPQGTDVSLRGVDPGPAPLSASAEQLAIVDGLPGAVLGEDLAQRLKVRSGEALRLVAVGFEGGRPRFRYRSLRVAGTLSTGLADFDNQLVLLDRRVVQSLGGRASLYEISLQDESGVEDIIREVEEVLGAEYLVNDGRELNREIFTALRLQKLALFLILGLIVVVSTFNVASTMVVLVREKMRDVGVLGALGLPPRKLQLVFVLCGTALGSLGSLCGVGVGWSISWLLTEYELIRFDADVAAIYFISSVPFRVQPVDVAAVVAFTLGVTLLACWSPARRAARIQPADALRYE